MSKQEIRCPKCNSNKMGLFRAQMEFQCGDCKRFWTPATLVFLNTSAEEKVQVLLDAAREYEAARREGRKPEVGRVVRGF